jgi:diguanylate cyclase (GGDEF)-like protein
VSTTQELKRERLLIVDSRQEMRDAMESAFRGKYDIVLAYDGEMALEVLNQDCSFDAILMDCELGGISGFDVLLRLSTLFILDSMPVIAYGRPEDELKALSMGAIEFLTSPVNVPALRHRLGNLLRLLRTEGSFDSLTGLFNRRKFITETHRLLQTDRARKYTMVYTNIERFRVMNDIYGYRTCDQILLELARTLRNLCPQGVVGRVGGDHFAICARRENVNPQMILDGTADIMRRCGLRQKMRLSMGLYDVEDRDMPVAQICDRAEMAMRTLREGGGALVARYDDRLRRELLEEQEITGEMEEALRTGQFHIYLQPIYSLTTGGPVSAEALVRWIHPRKGVIPPGKFIPLFERNGFITRLDAYVWEKVFQYLAEFRQQGYPDFPISANMSRIDFYDSTVCDSIVAMAEKYSVSPSLFRIEVTESAYMDNPDQLLDTIRQFNAAGFRVLMDDFGSGYSSLNMLMKIPVSTLKIDMGFIGDVGASERSNSIMNSVIRMAKWLEMTVIAEGVETQEQLDYLRSVGCDRVQGYYYSRPLPIEEFKGAVFSFPRDRIQEPKRTFDKLDLSAVWRTVNDENRTVGGILGAVGFYELAGDRVELVCVNDEYYKIMETTPGELFHDTKNALAWIQENDRDAFLDALRRAGETCVCQSVILNRYISSTTIKRLYLSVGRIGVKDTRTLFAISIRDISALRELDMAERLPSRKLLPAPPEDDGRPRVLIVEDNQVNRIVLCKMLSQEYAVVEASNGKEALSVLEHTPGVSAILLDIIMPIMDGYEFLENRLRDKALRKIPVLVLSQAEGRTDELRARELGAADFVRKPYEPEVVRGLLKKLIAPKPTRRKAKEK